MSCPVVFQCKAQKSENVKIYSYADHDHNFNTIYRSLNFFLYKKQHWLCSRATEQHSNKKAFHNDKYHVPQNIQELWSQKHVFQYKWL